VAAYWQSVVDLNAWKQHRIAQLLVQTLFANLTVKRIAILSFAFNADTNDTCEAPVIRICHDLLEEGSSSPSMTPSCPRLKWVQISGALPRLVAGKRWRRLRLPCVVPTPW
jgi:hypothetical protein